jgi:hypothetical protein
LELGASCGTVDVYAESNGNPVTFANYLLLLTGTPQEPGDVITGSVDGRGHVSIP